MTDAQDEGTKQGNGEAGGAAAQGGTPRLAILAQYVKDLSFENPQGPAAFAQPGQRPEIQVRVDVRGEEKGRGQQEIILELVVEAKLEDRPVFLLELAYGGLFALENVPASEAGDLLMVEGPRLLFPFARRLIADLTAEGGFPPLLLGPIDFLSLHRRRMARRAAAGGTPPAAQA